MHMDPIQGNYFKDFLDVLFKRKVVILLFFAATVCTAVIGVSFFQTKKYEAFSNILIETSRGYVSGRSLPTSDPRRINADGPSLAQQVDLALQVLKGNKLAIRVVETIGAKRIYENIGDAGLKKKLLRALGLIHPEGEQEMPLVELAALRLQQEVLVGRTGQHSPIIFVAFQHEDPEIAAGVVNTMVNLYFEYHLGLGKKPRLTRFFREQLAVKRTELENAELKLREFKDTYGIITTPEETISFLVEQKKSKQADLDEVVGQEAELDNEIKLLRHQLANTAQHPKAISALHQKLVELQVRESELSIRFKDAYPTLQDLRTEIRETQERLDELGFNKRYGSKSLTNSSSLYGDLQEKLMETELALNSVRARRDAITAQLIESDTGIKKLDSLRAEFLRHEEEVSMARESYKLYQTKREEFNISDALDAEGIANIQILDEARIPLGPIPPKTTLILLLSIFFGAVGGVTLALFIELFGGTLKKKEDTEQYLKRPVLATIPEYETGRLL